MGARAKIVGQSGFVVLCLCPELEHMYCNRGWGSGFRVVSREYHGEAKRVIAGHMGSN